MNRLTILPLLAILIFLFSCSQKEDLSEIDEFYLESARFAKAQPVKTYKFQIPKGYFERRYKPRKERLIFINALYPEMVYRTIKNEHRFKPNNSNDYIRIIFSIIPTKWEFKQPNYLSHPAVKPIIEAEQEERRKKNEEKIEKIFTPETIEKSEKVKTIRWPKGDSFDYKYFLSHKGKPNSEVDCPNWAGRCSGKVIWDKNLKIRYTFSKKHFNKMVDVDRAIISLIESFNPIHVN